MLWYALCLAAAAAGVAGHGRVIEPPSRASMWRMGFNTPPNYDDDGLNCGGFYHQYAITGGRCGICGDPFDMPEPRDHELGGRWGSGDIVAHYDQGQVFPATVEMTAYHKGFWEFRICTDPTSNKQECFDEHLLELEEGGTKYYPWMDGTYSLNLRLPADLVCEHCVLQWKYTAGNNWGVCNNGTEGLGCGNQETFGACSDISIGPVELPGLPPPPEDAPAPSEGPIEIDSDSIPICIDNSLDEVQGLLELIRKVAVRPRLTPKRTTPILLQRKNNRRKHRSKKIKPRKRKKFFWNFV